MIASILTAIVLATAPSPIPNWYWKWAQWYLGNGDYKCLAYRSQALRPKTPLPIPQWSWDKLHRQIAAGAVVHPACPATSLPPPVVPSPPAPPPSVGLTPEEQGILNDTNAQRAANGIQPPLTIDPKLEQAAHDKSANNAHSDAQLCR